MRIFTLAVVVVAGILLASPSLSAQAAASTTQAAKPTLNLNAATQAQLEVLPGIGPKVAARILEFRQKNGGFKKIEELMNVKGIGEKSFLKIKPLISVANPPVKATGGQ